MLLLTHPRISKTVDYITADERDHPQTMSEHFVRHRGSVLGEGHLVDGYGTLALYTHTNEETVSPFDTTNESRSGGCGELVNPPIVGTSAMITLLTLFAYPNSTPLN